MLTIVASIGVEVHILLEAISVVQCAIVHKFCFIGLVLLHFLVDHNIIRDVVLIRSSGFEHKVIKRCTVGQEHLLASRAIVKFCLVRQLLESDFFFVLCAPGSECFGVDRRVIQVSGV